MKHDLLLELRLTHSFYADGRCSDFAIEPTAETARLLRNHRCVLRTSPDGIHVLRALDDATGQPFLPIPSSATLGFRLVLENRDFVYFTDLTAIHAKSSPLFTNAGLAPGVSELVLVSGSAALAPGVLAHIEIQVAGLAAGAPPFHVAFQAKQRRWAYYCVTDLQPNGGDIGIVDAVPSGTTDVLLFGDGNRTDLGQAPDPSDPIATHIAARYPGMRCIRMLSDQPVACRQKPRKHLELRHGVDCLASPLPNPSLRHVSKFGTAQPVDVLYHIVKYRVNPFHNP
jgi:hypothetical protein